MSGRFLEMNEEDGYGDEFTLTLSDPDDGSGEVDLTVQSYSDKVILGLNLAQATEIRDALDGWVKQQRRKEVQRVRGSLS